MLFIPSTIGPPATFTIFFQRGVLSADLTSVTGITFGMLRRDGTSTTLTGTIVSSTPSELVAQYQFVGGELTGTGLYYLAPQLQVTGGTLPCETVAMMVDTPYAVNPQLETSGFLAATSTVSSAGPVSILWTDLTSASSPYTANRAAPWLAMDLSGGNLTVNLWAANGGDEVFFSDLFRSTASGHQLTLVGNGAQKVPVGDGTYTTSTTYVSAATFPLRLKYNATLGSWIAW